MSLKQQSHLVFPKQISELWAHHKWILGILGNQYFRDWPFFIQFFSPRDDSLDHSPGHPHISTGAIPEEGNLQWVAEDRMSISVTSRLDVAVRTSSHTNLTSPLAALPCRDQPFPRGSMQTRADCQGYCGVQPRSLRNDSQPHSSLGIPFRQSAAVSSRVRPSPQRVITDPKLPVDLAEVFAVIQKQFNSSICLHLLPTLLQSGWSWTHASKNCLHENLCLGGFFLENLRFCPRMN